MQYGAHCYLFTSRWADDQLHHLDRAREYGLGMFELSGGDDVRFDAGRTRRHAEGLGIDLLLGPGGEWPLECDLSADTAADRARGLDWHRKMVDLAAELGARAYMGALYGHPGVVRKRRPPADEIPRTAEGLHALAEYAHARNVILALEPMSHFRTHVANTPQQVLFLIQLANHPALKVLFDTYHIVTEVRDYGAAIRSIGNRLFAVHACENDRGAPGGGLIPWEALFRSLHDIGFNGYIGLEGYNSSLGDFAFERGMFHNVSPNVESFVRKGVGFLRLMEEKTRKPVT